MGDYNGIGPEVILKTLSNYSAENVAPLVLGHENVLRHYNNSGDHHTVTKPEDALPGKVNVMNCVKESQVEITPGKINKQAGACSMESVAMGIELCLSGKADALVTAPISKEAIQKAGYDVPGHTEFLAEKTETEDFMMILANKNLRVGLATIHVPLSAVPSLITQKSLVRHLSILDRSLKRDFGRSSPKIAVFGLNPHAGDGGVIGTEEIDIIKPAVIHAQHNGIEADGPFAADGFFGNRMQNRYDAILAMYHDQGLIPFKALTFGTGVNFTAGLPIIRTSPDHGTAFDIAGQNKADHRSFESAFLLAVQMAGNKNRASD